MNKVEIGEETGWVVDEPSCQQLKLNCREQVHPARFAHRNQESGKNRGAAQDLDADPFHFILNIFDLLHVDINENISILVTKCCLYYINFISQNFDFQISILFLNWKLKKKKNCLWP